MTTKPALYFRRLIACSLVAISGSLCLALFGCKSREAAATANGPARVDGKWDYEDRKTIAIADPSGANYVEIIAETDEILQRTMHAEDKLTVVYQSNAKHFIADIDLPQRQVTTKDLPAIP